MKNIEGIYKMDVLGPYGWENFSTAFINDGEFRSTSAEHFTYGTYAVEDNGFEMEGNLTQLDSHYPLFGRSDIKGLPIKFRGSIQDGVIDGEASLPDDSRNSLRLRLNRLPFLN
jgi:hypothetical protein